MTKKTELIIISIFLSMLLFVPEAIPATHAAPPPNLFKIFQALSTFETDFRSHKWESAASTTNDIHAAFQNILPEIMKSMKIDVEQEFHRRLGTLQKVVKDKNENQTESKFIELENFIFTLTDNFDYKIPPVLQVMDEYISEALIAVKHADFKRVKSEMDEVEDFISHSDSYLISRGASRLDVDEFKSQVREVRHAGSTRNKQEAESGIKNLKSMSGKFLKLFSK